MANIGQLKTRISLYLQKPLKDFGADGENLILAELNNARRFAETNHAWHCEERLLSLSVLPDDGGDFTTAPELGAGEKVKMVEQYYLNNDAGLIPLLHVNKKRISNDKRKELKNTSFGFENRFQGDVGSGSIYNNHNPKVYVWNNLVYFDPDITESTDISVDAYVWLKDYTNDTDEDWFTEHGAEYLQWYCVVALNYFTGTYAPRQEGVLPPPEKAKQDAYNNLMSFDNHQYQKGRIAFV